MPKHAAGRPVSFPYADAANAAAPSWRIPKNLSFLAFSARRHAREREHRMRVAFGTQ